MTECDHPADEVFYYPSVNEDGWKCVGCDEQLGYRPDLDRDMAERKVFCMLQDFHTAKLIYISNGTMGEIITDNAARRCRQEGLYDQHSILRFILEDPNLATHAPFWKTRAERHFLGAEPIRDNQEALPF